MRRAAVALRDDEAVTWWALLSTADLLFPSAAVVVAAAAAVAAELRTQAAHRQTEQTVPLPLEHTTTTTELIAAAAVTPTAAPCHSCLRSQDAHCAGERADHASLPCVTGAGARKRERDSGERQRLARGETVSSRRSGYLLTSASRAELGVARGLKVVLVSGIRHAGMCQHGCCCSERVNGR